MTRTLISLAPLAAALTIIAVRLLVVARRRKREDQETAERIEAGVAARRAEDAYIAWLEEQFAPERPPAPFPQERGWL
jgi:hypothetical protein